MSLPSSADETPSCPAAAPAADVVVDPLVRDLDGETRRLLDAGALARVDLLGVPAWAVTRHETARRLLTDRRLVKDIDRWTLYRTGAVTDEWPLIGMVAPGRSMLTVDGAEHRRLRTKTAQAITPRRLEGLRPVVEDVTHRLLDALAARASGDPGGPGGADGPAAPVDLKAHFALPLPMSVICTLMGVDPALHPRLHTLYGAFFSTLTPQDERLAVIAELHEIFTDMVRARTAEPRDDLTSALILADEGGDPLTEEEVVGNLQTIVLAGHETTVGLVLNAVRALLTHPGQLRAVLDGEAGWDAVIEETLRWDTPVTHVLMRFATEDVEVDGTVIREGEGVIVSYRAIGRDSDRHGPDADDFDITRDPRTRHLAFGHGPHICPGAALARMEAGIALPALFERFPGLRLAVPAEEIVNQPVLTQNDLRSFPVHLRGDGNGSGSGSGPVS